MAYISAAESIRVSSTTFTPSAQKATGVGEIKQPSGLIRRSRSFKVIEFGTNRKRIYVLLLLSSFIFQLRLSTFNKVYDDDDDFLLVINSNLPPILHRFRDIASERSKIATFFYTVWFNPPDGGVPLGRSP